MDEKLFTQLISEINLVIEKYKKDVIKQFYEIGKLIVANQSNFPSREELLKSLSKKLGEGYGKANLSDMRRLYEIYKDKPEQFELAQQIGWTHNRTLLTINDEKKRIDWITRMKNENWSNSKLVSEIENYNNTLNSKAQSIDYKDFNLNIEQIVIKNFKSIVDIKINRPEKFSVFVGVNGSGKSNIFEALEMLFNANKVEKEEIFTSFGKKEDIINYNAMAKKDDHLLIEIDCSDKSTFFIEHKNNFSEKKWTDKEKFNKQFLSIFSRLFIDSSRICTGKLPLYDKLTQNADNLIKILKEKILPDETLFNSFKANLFSLRANIERIDVKLNNSDVLELQIKEKDYDKPFSEKLVSDGTMKIVALISILFQTNNPQFLCIEEPENGLHPFLIKEFVSLCRNLCAIKGDYIWLTTHSPVVVRELSKNELIIVNNIGGKTEISPAKDIETTYDFKMDDAWLTNNLKGGLPW